MPAMSDDAALIVYFTVLWGAVLGIMAPGTSRSWICRGSKALAGVTFACLVLDLLENGAS